jgi:outer membrane immunogenic protein
MRRLLVVVGLVASISGASAQEFELPTLRGTSSFVPDAPGPLYVPRWSGFYVGGQVGWGIASMNFATATQDLVAHELRNLALEDQQHPSQWQVLGKADTGTGSIGGFLGYNIGWECLILGVELNYSHTNFTADAPLSPLTRVTSANGLVYLVNLTGSASMHITDYGTLRARAGYVTGNFMPYAFAGAAWGRADLSRSATASGTETVPNSNPLIVTPFSFTESETKNGAFLFGWTLGGGLEVMLMPKVFLRAEYEYIAFQQIWGIKSQIQTARAGVGYKF